MYHTIVDLNNNHKNKSQATGAWQGQNLWGGQIKVTKTLGWPDTPNDQMIQGLYSEFRISLNYWGGQGYPGHPSYYAPHLHWREFGTLAELGLYRRNNSNSDQILSLLSV